MTGENLVAPERADFETLLRRPVWNELNLSICCVVSDYEKKKTVECTTFVVVGMK